MKNKFLIGILVFLAELSCYSQSLTVFDVDTTDFPTIRAKFFALDTLGNQLDNFSISDFKIKENGLERAITSVSCPPQKPYIPLSSILTVDISSSMFGEKLTNAKSACRSWVGGLNTVQSECAVITFNTKNYLNQDFTSNKTLLLNAIGFIVSNGGTDINAAFLNQMSGSLLLAEGRENKSIIVLLTDDPMPGNENAIIKKANQLDATIYCIAMDMPCTEQLKKIADQTGGKWFENITTEEAINDIIFNILLTAQGVEPCIIEWQSPFVCTEDLTKLDVSLIKFDITSSLKYKNPNKAIAKLVIEPNSVTFENVLSGKKRDTLITITAINSDFNITNIKTTNSDYTIFPSSFNLKKGDTLYLTLSYYPMDSTTNYARMEFENDLCNTYFHAKSEWVYFSPKERILTILHPNGGEVFVAGSDTIITWYGVLPTDPVTIEYRTDDTQPWIKLTDSARGFSYPFKAPNVVSDKYLARVTYKPLVINEMITIPAGSFIMGGDGWSPMEKPKHKVTISKDFMMSKYEVTQYEYREVVGANPSNRHGDNLPVDNVSWYDAINYCNKRSDFEGLKRCYKGIAPDIVCDWNASGYRLPTEAEWEYACRAGSAFGIYGPMAAIAWYDNNSGGKPHEVGQLLPNKFGLYDMIGNVREHCWDWLIPYSADNQIDPTGPATGLSRSIRGGAWDLPADKTNASYRSDLAHPDKHYIDAGFRVVRIIK